MVWPVCFIVSLFPEVHFSSSIRTEGSDSHFLKQCVRTDRFLRKGKGGGSSAAGIRPEKCFVEVL